MKTLYLVFVATAATLLVACAPSQEEAGAEPLRSVRFTQVTEQDPAVTRRFSGITAARDELPVAFRVPGQISDVRVVPGRRVAQGELIARLDSQEYELEVQRSAAALDSARAQARTVESAYQRTRELYQNDSASRRELEAAQANLEAAQSSLVGAEAQLERARLQLSYTEVRAPFAGEVAGRFVDPGAVVGAGQAVVALSGERIERVQFSVPEDIVARISEGMSASVSVEAADLIAAPGQIVEVSSGSAQQGALFPVEVELRVPPTAALRAGMAATIDVALRTEGQGRYLVPPHAVLEDENGRHLYVVIPTPDSDPPVATVQRREVVTGALTDAGLAVTAGLQTGDRVVVAGMSRLRDGMIVRSPE